MAKWGKFEFKEFEKMAKAFQKAVDEDVIDGFIRDFINEMAQRLVRKIKQYMREQNIIASHQLIDSWRIGPITRQGDEYSIEIFCPVEYASYVEYGFRAHWVPGYWLGDHFVYDPSYKPPLGEPAGIQVGPKNGWVPGRFMMTLSTKVLEKELPKYLEKRMEKLLEKLMKGG